MFSHPHARTRTRTRMREVVADKRLLFLLYSYYAANFAGLTGKFYRSHRQILPV